jgi:hypothetical protein
MPVTTMAFKYDQNGNATHVLSGSSDYSYNIIPCRESLFGWIIKQSLWMLLIAVVIAWALT